MPQQCRPYVVTGCRSAAVHMSSPAAAVLPSVCRYRVPATKSYPHFELPGLPQFCCWYVVIRCRITAVNLLSHIPTFCRQFAVSACRIASTYMPLQDATTLSPLCRHRASVPLECCFMRT